VFSKESISGEKLIDLFIQWHDLVCSMLGQYKVVALYGSVKRKKISLPTP
jgi:hypothetical protein